MERTSANTYKHSLPTPTIGTVMYSQIQQRIQQHRREAANTITQDGQETDFLSTR